MTDKIEDGGPAFPNENFSLLRNGMSLRDYFAGKAMEGALSSPRTFAAVGSEDQFDKVLCERAYQVADAMLAARKASA